MERWYAAGVSGVYYHKNCAALLSVRSIINHQIAILLSHPKQQTSLTISQRLRLLYGWQTVIEQLIRGRGTCKNEDSPVRNAAAIKASSHRASIHGFRQIAKIDEVIWRYSEIRSNFVDFGDEANLNNTILYITERSLKAATFDRHIVLKPPEKVCVNYIRYAQ